MGSGHSHGSGLGHSHAPDRSTSKRALRIALGLTATFTIAEVIGGLISGSLALLADAGHMLSDVASLALALGAISLAGRQAGPRHSFGYRRAEILAALINGTTLVLISLWIFYEAAQRLNDPHEVLAGPMLAVAVAGLGINLAAAYVLSRDTSESLNVSAALRHVLADLAGSVGVIVAAIVILLTGWERADPIIGAAIGLLVLISAIPILREATSILLEGAPAGIDPEEVGQALVKAPGVVEVHDLHIWTITSGFPALSAHVLVAAEEDCHARRRELEQLLIERFEISHSTLQMEHEGPDLLQVDCS